MKFRLSSQRRIYSILLIIALGIAAFTTFLLSLSMTPYHLAKIKQEVGIDYVVYHDFDKDGISETFSANNNEGTGFSWISAKNFDDQTIDQCNYSEVTHYNLNQQWLFFADYNGDNLDDVFAITQKNDSLFLYIHDLHLKHVVLKRQFLLEAKYPAMIHLGGMIDLPGEDKKGIIFGFVSGLDRGVYIFDIKKRTIFKHYESNAFFYDLILYDLTGNGKKEIILSTLATGNFHEPVPYTDQKCWLFVFDQNLKPIFKPLSFGKYLSALSCAPIEINEQRYLLIYYGVGYDKNLSDLLFLVSPKGSILPQKKFKISPRYPAYKHFVVSQREDKPVIYTWLGKNELIKLDEKLKVIQKKETPFEEIVPLEIQDFDKDGTREILCVSKEHLSIFSEQFELLAYVPHAGTVTLRHRGVDKPIDIGLNSYENYFYLFAFEKNLYYSSLPFFGFGLWGFLFLLLIGTYKASSRLFIHFKYNRFSLVGSPEAALMLDHAGVIIKTNNRLHELHDTSKVSLKNKHFSKALIAVPQLVNLIRQSISSGKAMQKNVSVTKDNNSFECKANVTPFTSGRGFLTCYLVEIRLDTESVLSDKLQIWSKAAAKMVHDIKYPLSVVSIKLGTLRTRLEKIPISENEKIDEDISTIRDEINRVHAIARSFLKFSDIEKPNFEEVDICEIIDKAIQRFRTYIGEDLRIETAAEDGIKGVRADAQQIEFVLGSLIENSIEALNGAGLIKISATLAQYLDRSFQEVVEVEVADTGPGIPADVADQVFKPHFTTKTEGTGMGLAGAKKIIDDHGGSIGLYSKQDFGTVIRFSLPVYQVDEAKNK